MVQVADLQSSADKFERRASQAGQDFEDGVSSVSSQEQQQATLESVDSWEQGVQEAINNGSFEAGVRSPAQDWQQRTLSVGRQRFTQGVQGSGQAWREGFQPVADTLEGLSLQPRGSRGSAANRDRMNAVFDALSNTEF
jgi:hypothetical protein